MRVVERLGLPQHAPRGRLPHLDRVVEVLDADPPEHRVLVVRDVARGEHLGRGGPERGVDLDPTRPRRQPAGHRQLDVGHGPDADDREVALQPLPLRGDDGLDPAVALEPIERVPEEHLHSVVAVQALDRPADLRAEHPLQGSLERLHRRYVDPEVAQGGRHLTTDEAHPDQDRP